MCIRDSRTKQRGTSGNVADRTGQQGVYAEYSSARKCRVPVLRADGENEVINENHAYHVEQQIHHVITECVQAAPIEVQSVTEEQQLPPAQSKFNDVTQRM